MPFTHIHLCVILVILFHLFVSFPQLRHWEGSMCNRFPTSVHTAIHTYCYTYILPYIHTATHTYCHTYILLHIHTAIHTYCYTYILPYIHTATHTYCHTYILLHIHTAIHTYCYTYILPYIQVCCSSPLERLYSDFRGFNNGVCNVIRITITESNPAMELLAHKTFCFRPNILPGKQTERRKKAVK